METEMSNGAATGCCCNNPNVKAKQKLQINIPRVSTSNCSETTNNQQQNNTSSNSTISMASLSSSLAQGSSTVEPHQSFRPSVKLILQQQENVQQMEQQQQQQQNIQQMQQQQQNIQQMQQQQNIQQMQQQQNIQQMQQQQQQQNVQQVQQQQQNVQQVQQQQNIQQMQQQQNIQQMQQQQQQQNVQQVQQQLNVQQTQQLQQNNLQHLATNIQEINLTPMTNQVKSLDIASAAIDIKNRSTGNNEAQSSCATVNSVNASKNNHSNNTFKDLQTNEPIGSILNSSIANQLAHQDQGIVSPQKIEKSPENRSLMPTTKIPEIYERNTSNIDIKTNTENKITPASLLYLAQKGKKRYSLNLFNKLLYV